MEIGDKEQLLLAINHIGLFVEQIFLPSDMAICQVRQFDTYQKAVVSVELFSLMIFSSKQQEVLMNAQQVGLYYSQSAT